MPAIATITVLGLLLAGLAFGAESTTGTQARPISIAFLGDSITNFGTREKGYVRLVEAGLTANGFTVTVIPAGVNGSKSNDMRQRLEKDVLAHKPDWMTLSCGVNDVWHGEKGVPLDGYQRNITAILDNAAKAGVKVMVLTASVIQEDLDNDLNRRLAPYNDWLRAQAAERKLPLADVNADFQAAIKAKGRHLTGDGVHLNDAGNRVMALCVLRAFGLDDRQIASAVKAWDRR